MTRRGAFMAATIKDIAKEAGVSPATVSRVLSGQTEFYSEKTAKKVKKAAKELGYQKNTAAVELVTRRSRVIAVIVSATKTNFSDQIIDGIQQEATKNDLNVIILYAGEKNPESERKALETVIERSVMGILLVAVDLEPSNADLLMSANIPFQFLSITLRNRKLPFITSNDFQIGYQATKYLIDKGHAKIGFVAADLESMTGHLRLNGYKQAMADNGLTADPKWIYGGDWVYEDGVAAMKRFGRDTPLSAIMASSDLAAIGVMNQAQDFGMRIPRDMAVMSVDGTKLCQIVRPQLTSVTQEFFEMGVRGMNRIINKSVKSAESTFTPIRIIERQSV
ncbi:transcriptional regulator, LacI family [Lentilactobacillus kisonensis F0435]|uniref:Transcriptional regulator, LacI family n=2 Tax=Lentilactobacillus kisonensis TaxID=481722 RepID=H1LFL4_9LACO|nr:transcriptional regulator, LacI family [Lentilactobacillus kisonensis F0435]